MPQIAKQRRSLTKELVTRAKPQAKKFTVWDSTVPDFGLRVYPSGAKSYVLRLNFEDSRTGKRVDRTETVGKVEDFASPEKARQKALGIRQQYKAGEDLKAKRKAQQGRKLTLREGMEQYLAARSSGTKPMKASTAEDYRKKLEHGLKDWMDRPLVDLDDQAKIEWHRARKLSAPTRADGEARYLRAVWNWVQAEHEALGLPDWPTRRWSKQQEWSAPNRRSRRLNRENAPAWWVTTQAWANERDRALFLLLYFTGWRISEAMSLRWADVDLDRARVLLRDIKTRQDLELPLARQAVEALQTLPQTTEWVFPAPRKDGSIGPMVRPSKAVVRHIEDCGIAWAPHDLRRTFISVGESIGVPTAAVRRLTGHAISTRDAHDGYIGFDPHDLAPHLQRVADALEGLASGEKGAVVSMPGADKEATA